MISHRAGQRERALHRVKAVHGVIFFDDLTTLGKIAGITERAGFGVEKVRVDGHHPRGLIKVVNRLNVLAKDRFGGRRGRLVIYRIIFSPNGLWQFLLKRFDETSATRRRGGLG